MKLLGTKNFLLQVVVMNILGIFQNKRGILSSKPKQRQQSAWNFVCTFNIIWTRLFMLSLWLFRNIKKIHWLVRGWGCWHGAKVNELLYYKMWMWQILYSPYAVLESIHTPYRQPLQISKATTCKRKTAKQTEITLELVWYYKSNVNLWGRMDNFCYSHLWTRCVVDYLPFP